MPSTGKKWRHVIINTKGTWLHGDPRGFRHRGHRIHSSGDYRNPPPPDEHHGLYGYQVGKSRPETHFTRELRRMIGIALRDDLKAKAHRVLTIAVGKVHAHTLVELPDNIQRIRAIVGDAKRRSSRAVKQHLPGSVWAAGGTYKPVDTRAHQHRAFNYILYDQGPGAWTWSFQDTSQEGQFRRKPPPSNPPPRRGRT